MSVGKVEGLRNWNNKPSRRKKFSPKHQQKALLTALEAL